MNNVSRIFLLHYFLWILLFVDINAMENQDHISLSERIGALPVELKASIFEYCTYPPEPISKDSVLLRLKKWNDSKTKLFEEPIQYRKVQINTLFGSHILDESKCSNIKQYIKNGEIEPNRALLNLLMMRSRGIKLFNNIVEENPTMHLNKYTLAGAYHIEEKYYAKRMFSILKKHCSKNPDNKPLFMALALGYDDFSIVDNFSRDFHNNQKVTLFLRHLHHKAISKKDEICPQDFIKYADKYYDMRISGYSLWQLIEIFKEDGKKSPLNDTFNASKESSITSSSYGLDRITMKCGERLVLSLKGNYTILESTENKAYRGSYPPPEKYDAINHLLGGKSAFYQHPSIEKRSNYIKGMTYSIDELQKTLREYLSNKESGIKELDFTSIEKKVFDLAGYRIFSYHKIKEANITNEERNLKCKSFFAHEDYIKELIYLIRMLIPIRTPSFFSGDHIFMSGKLSYFIPCAGGDLQKLIPNDIYRKFEYFNVIDLTPLEKLILQQATNSQKITKKVSDSIYSTLKSKLFYSFMGLAGITYYVWPFINGFFPDIIKRK
jgi:hypothetical protein